MRERTHTHAHEHGVPINTNLSLAEQCVSTFAAKTLRGAQSLLNTHAHCHRRRTCTGRRLCGGCAKTRATPHAHTALSSPNQSPRTSAAPHAGTVPGSALQVAPPLATPCAARRGWTRSVRGVPPTMELSACASTSRLRRRPRAGRSSDPRFLVLLGSSSPAPPRSMVRACAQLPVNHSKYPSAVAWRTADGEG